MAATNFDTFCVSSDYVMPNSWKVSGISRMTTAANCILATVPAPPSIKLVSTAICKIVTEMWLVVSPRCDAVSYPP